MDLLLHSSSSLLPTELVLWVTLDAAAGADPNRSAFTWSSSGDAAIRESA